MTENPVIETCGYRFRFTQSVPDVKFVAVPLDGHDITNKDEERVKGCLSDMGKWESVARALSDLATGTILPSPHFYDIKTFNPDAYQAWTSERRDLVEGTVSLTREERLQRDKGIQGSGSTLLVSEVLGQLQNVEKWRNLRRAISLVRQS